MFAILNTKTEVTTTAEMIFVIDCGLHCSQAKIPELTFNTFFIILINHMPFVLIRNYLDLYYHDTLLFRNLNSKTLLWQTCIVKLLHSCLKGLSASL